MRRVRRHTAVFIALVLAGGLAACGDDEDSDDSGSGAGGTPTSAQAAPADAVDVTMTEYSFAIGGDLKPGGTIRLSNAGKEFHLMAMGKLKPGKTLAELTTALTAPPPDEEGPTTTAAGGGSTTTAATGGSTTTTAGQEEEEEEDPTAEFLDEVGLPGTIQGPGQKAEITAPDLAAGTYALICFIPTEGGGPPHFLQGMIAQLTVTGEKAKEPTADATFVVAPGKPVTGPSTLTAGRHVLKFEGAAGADVEQLEPGIVKLDTGKTVADVNAAFESFETPDDFVLPVNAAAQVPGKVVAALFDFGPSSRVAYVAADFTAGTYGIIASDTDPEDSPTDPIEKAIFTVT